MALTMTRQGGDDSLTGPGMRSLVIRHSMIELKPGTGTSYNAPGALQ